MPLQASALRLSRPSAQRNFLDGTTAADRAKLPTPTRHGMRPQATRPCAHAHMHHPLGGLAGDLGGQVKSAA